MSTTSDPYAQDPITELKLPSRYTNALRGAGIYTIGDFGSACAKGTLKNISNIGLNSAAEIGKAFRVYRKTHPADGCFKIVGDFMLVNDTTWIKIPLVSKVVTLIHRENGWQDKYGTLIYLHGSENPVTIPCDSAKDATEQTEKIVKKIVNTLAESKESARITHPMS